MFVLVAVLAIALFLSSNFYLAWRIASLLRSFFTDRKRYDVIIYTAVGVLALVLILGIVTDIRLFGVISALYLGIWINLLLSALICELVFFMVRLFTKDKSLKTVRMIHGGVALALPIILSFYGFMNAAIVKKTEYSLEFSTSREELKIAMLSDLHLGAVGSEAKLERWVEAINEESPDIVLIAGDLIDSNYGKIQDPERAVALLASISAKYGVYACLGNHDAGKTYKDMLSFFVRANITVLQDEYVVIDDALVLVGRRDLSPIGGTADEHRIDTDAVLGNLPDLDIPIIVMDHNPSDIHSYDERVDLIVSGHTHKGQVFPANFVTNMIYTVDYGVYRQDETSPYVIVSCGIGGWGMPMKTAGHSELVIITMKNQ